MNFAASTYTVNFLLLYENVEKRIFTLPDHRPPNQQMYWIQKSSENCFYVKIFNFFGFFEKLTAPSTGLYLGIRSSMSLGSRLYSRLSPRG